jgi:hypothetical protein
MFNQENPNAIIEGYSAGGTRLYLGAQNDIGSFENSQLQWFGAPVNSRGITLLANDTAKNSPVVKNNKGDFVGNILGLNAGSFGETGRSIISAPLLITPLSSHSNYVCVVCDNK